MPMKKGRGRKGVGQSFKAAPKDLRAPALPPASDVVVKQADGSVLRIEPALDRMPADINRPPSKTPKPPSPPATSNRFTRETSTDSLPKPKKRNVPQRKPRKARRSRSQRPAESSLDPTRLYVLSTDGASVPNPGPSAIGAVLRGPNGEVTDRMSRSIGFATNNQAEYRALIEGVRLAIARGARQLLIRSDSKLIVQQILGQWAVKNEELRPFRSEARELLGRLDCWELKHVLRDKNAEADQLADAALGLEPNSDRVVVVYVAKSDRRCTQCREVTRRGEQVYLVHTEGKKVWVCAVCAEGVSRPAAIE